MMMRIFTVVAGIALLALGGIVSASAEPNPFDGKTITYIVATKPGGGYDTMGRLVARYLEKHLPGSRIIVKNIPGAGHLVGAKTINAADPDGLTIGTFNTGLIYQQLTSKDFGDLDLAKMSWIGKAAIESRVLVASTKSNLKTLDDFRDSARKVKMAAAGKGSASYQESRILSETFKLNTEILAGYEGTESELAMMRGEIDAYLGSASALKPFIDNGHGRIILEVGGKAGSPYPQARDLAEGVAAKSIISFIETQAQLSRLTVGPPAIPPPELKALRDAYMAALTDPQLLAEAEKLELPIAPLSGDVVAERVRSAFSLPPQTLGLLKELLEDK
jgi:tripartite-type tricarboxylate transporter receptor subunit TctC